MESYLEGLDQSIAKNYSDERLLNLHNIILAEMKSRQNEYKKGMKALDSKREELAIVVENNSIKLFGKKTGAFFKRMVSKKEQEVTE